MYSPRISEELVPVLYRIGKAKRIPMTKLVDGIIRSALARNDLPQGKLDADQMDASSPIADPRPAAAA